jgi:hypothetical protein
MKERLFTESATLTFNEDIGRSMLLRNPGACGRGGSTKIVYRATPLLGQQKLLSK